MQHGSLKTPNSMAADNCPKQPNHQEPVSGCLNRLMQPEKQNSATAAQSHNRPAIFVLPAHGLQASCRERVASVSGCLLAMLI